MTRIFYATSEHDRDDMPFPLRADAWFYSVGNCWSAVFSDFHEDWWDSADPQDVARRPAAHILPIHQLPVSGTLHYRGRKGKDKQHAADSIARLQPRSRCAIAAASGDLEVAIADTTPTEGYRGLLQHLRRPIEGSGFTFPEGAITVRCDGALGEASELAIACALLAADGQINGERLALWGLHATLQPDGSLTPPAVTPGLGAEMYRIGASGLLVADPDTIDADVLHVHQATTLREAVDLLTNPAASTPAPTPFVDLIHISESERRRPS